MVQAATTYGTPRGWAAGEKGQDDAGMCIAIIDWDEPRESTDADRDRRP